VSDSAETIPAPAAKPGPPDDSTTMAMERPPARLEPVGKFLCRGGVKTPVRGVTYGPFTPTDASADGFDPRVAERDLSAMAAAGFNAVRVYSVPPAWLLDAAMRHGVAVMVGMPWEQHVTFLDDRRRARDIEERVRAGVRACAGHPAVLCYAIGNEIPAPIVRWHGRRRIERYLERLYHAVKEEDPEGAVTYVNFPSTEYLNLPFLDLLSFNVYLEDRASLSAYLARLQNLAWDLPLVMTELGLDSRRHGEDVQARTLEWQVRETLDAGCAGAFVFSWTDEWHRGGHEIRDWQFGLTTRERRPKPALEAVARALPEGPTRPSDPPSASVIVCTHNDAATLGECLAGVEALRYPRYEAIVVDDGSTDSTPEVARSHDVRLITTDHQGLASARNVGLAAGGGEIVAYVDADARPDPDWLTHLARRFTTTEDVGVGGPNLPWPGATGVARAVADAPGAPTHVLVSDTEAEHIPGCNMAFRRDTLEAVGGFDPRFHAAGDDVDVCWRLADRGLHLGFRAGAVVWHHRRDSVRAYLRQQRGYGEAEGLLERKWPQKYSPAGHPTWHGRVYGSGAAEFHGQRRWRVYHGIWGSSAFQSVYRPANGALAALPLMPEFYLVIAALLALSLGALAWEPLLAAVPLLAMAVTAVLVDAALGAARSTVVRTAPSGLVRLRAAGLVGLLYVLQPLARLYGRVRVGLTPLRRRGPRRLCLPRTRELAVWSERWSSPESRLEAIERRLVASGAAVRRGGPYARWDLEMPSGPLGATRLRMAVEEHGGGRQLVRCRQWPRPSRAGLVVGLVLAGLSAAAVLDRAWVVAGILAAAALVIMVRIAQECAASSAALTSATKPSSLASTQDRR
jgi:GT2 family glycosyltransferase